MLNPSTADAAIDDPTIRRCIEFSKRWGFGSMRVVNLYAYRATDPSELKPLTYAERCGPLNAWHQHMALQDAAVVVAAWGGGRLDPLPSALISYDKPLQCLKRLKDGSPGHPLYIAGDTPLTSWMVSDVPQRVPANMVPQKGAVSHERYPYEIDGVPACRCGDPYCTDYKDMS
jgi:hypothetical protein